MVVTLIQTIPSWLIPALLSLLSVITVAIILEKGFFLYYIIRDMSYDTEAEISRMIESGAMKEATDFCREQNDPVSMIMVKVLENVIRKQEPSGVLIERELRILADRLQHRLPTLGTISTIAPLLGLLGTVTGMIKSFHAVEASGAGGIQNRLMVGGIDEALITTTMGLIIAIPALIAYNTYSHRVNRITERADSVMRQILEKEGSGNEKST